MNQYGYAATHREIVTHMDKSLGKPEEQAAFALKNLDAMDGFLIELRKHLETSRTMTASPAADQKDWKTQKRAINKELRKFRSSLDSYFDAYVVILEQGLRKRLQLAGTTISNLVRAHGKAQKQGARRVASVKNELDTLSGLISERRPASQQEPLVPEHEEEGGEGS